MRIVSNMIVARSVPISRRRSVVCAAFASLLPTMPIAARTSTPLVVAVAVALVLETFAPTAYFAAAAASTFSFAFAFLSLLSFLSGRLASSSTFHRRAMNSRMIT